MTGKCEVCGNTYDKAFNITTADGRNHTFDCFECAVHALAPNCANCGVKVIGHGIEANGEVFCCEHCSQQKGVAEKQLDHRKLEETQDRMPATPGVA